MNVLFVLDTSASMNQRTSGGLTLIDCAKSAVEHFLKVRTATPDRACGWVYPSAPTHALRRGG